ncbi:hypothetical protein CBR_g37812 [Chara braunii]|uniref:Uncharacterized protein n=1 Tax=Chara braunii TaxID=69332 RepID=A0A388LNL6_CHABU|nr:hypothetical protein CBR_g37812 [Chara braunii]|eukprot:GBG83940.1 hypothetical protein CBR_g37812 [Chara braunii]
MPAVTRSMTGDMDRKEGETEAAYEARMLDLTAEMKKRTDAATAARKKKEEDLEEQRRLAEEQHKKGEAAAAKAADEERVRRRQGLFKEECALHALAADWRKEAEGEAANDCRSKLAVLLTRVMDPLATCIAQQEDIYSLDHVFARNILFECKLFHGDPNQITGVDGTWHATPVGLLLHADLSLLHVRAGLSQQFPVLPDGSGRASGIYVGFSWKKKINEDTTFPATVVQLEWSHADRQMQLSVVGELDVGEAVNAILLIRTDERMKHHLSGLMCPLRLPVRLWMSSRTWFHLGVGFLHERSPECRHETSVAVVDDVFQYVVVANPAGVQEAHKFRSRGVVLAREKLCVLTRSVNDREDVVVPEAVAGKQTGDVHSNGEAGFPWDGQRAQLTVGIAVVGLASTTNFARVAIPSDIGNEVGPLESLPKSCDSPIDSEMAGESRFVVLAEKASPKTTVSWDTQ